MVLTVRKKRKSETFAKVKLRVGKAKALPTSATSINIKTKALVVPVQSITLDKSGLERTKSRNLTLKEILCGLGHRKLASRRDAVASLQELLTEHPHLTSMHFATIWLTVIPLVVDPEPSVRVALLKCMGFLVPTLKERQLQPFGALFAVYMSSAMTHILPEIQLDSLKLLALFLARFENFLKPHSAILLSCFIGMLTALGQSDASHSHLSIAMHHQILTTLGQYVRFFAREPPSSSAETKSHEEVNQVANFSHFPTHRLAALPFASPNRPAAHIVAHSFDSITSAISFIDAIVPHVTAVWVEAAESVFDRAKVQQSEKLDLCHAAITFMENLLLIQVLSDGFPAPWVKLFRKGPLATLTRNFPFGMGTQVDKLARPKILSMNLSAINVTCALVRNGSSSSRNNNNNGNIGSNTWVPFLQQMFEDPQQFPMVPATLAQIERCVSLSHPATFGKAFLAAILRWTKSLPATDQMWSSTTAFVADLITSRAIHLPKGSRGALHDFVMSTIEYLLAIGDKVPVSMADGIFRFLRFTLCSDLCAPDFVATTLRVQYARLFSPTVASSPNTIEGQSVFQGYSKSMQMRALDVLFYFPCAVPEGVMDALVLEGGQVCPHVSRYGLNILHLKVEAQAMQLVQEKPKE